MAELHCCSAASTADLNLLSIWIPPDDAQKRPRESLALQGDFTRHFSLPWDGRRCGRCFTMLLATHARVKSIS